MRRAAVRGLEAGERGSKTTMYQSEGIGMEGGRAQINHSEQYDTYNGKGRYWGWGSIGTDPGSESLRREALWWGNPMGMGPPRQTAAGHQEQQTKPAGGGRAHSDRERHPPKEGVSPLVHTPGEESPPCAGFIGGCDAPKGVFWSLGSIGYWQRSENRS
jgi:hypothetical protein